MLARAVVVYVVFNKPALRYLPCLSVGDNNSLPLHHTPYTLHLAFTHISLSEDERWFALMADTDDISVVTVFEFVLLAHLVGGKRIVAR